MSTANYFIEKGRIETKEKMNVDFVKNLLLANKFSVAEIANYAYGSEVFVQQVTNTLT